MGVLTFTPKKTTKNSSTCASHASGWCDNTVRSAYQKPAYNHSLSSTPGSLELKNQARQLDEPVNVMPSPCDRQDLQLPAKCENLAHTAHDGLHGRSYPAKISSVIHMLAVDLGPHLHSKTKNLDTLERIKSRCVTGSRHQFASRFSAELKTMT